MSPSTTVKREYFQAHFIAVKPINKLMLFSISMIYLGENKIAEIMQIQSPVMTLEKVGC